MPDKPDQAIEAWSWRDLKRQAQNVARLLAETGRARRGGRVLLAYSGGLDFIAALFGCFYLGVIPIPVAPPRRRETHGRLEHILRDAEAVGILTSDALLGQLRPVAEQRGDVFCLSPAVLDPDGPTPNGSGLDTPKVKAEDVAFVQYTSGSTEAPKGVAVTHGNIMANMAQIAEVFQITAEDHMVSWLPHYHDMGLIGTVLSPLYSGHSITFMTPAVFLRSPMRFLELASASRATGFGSPNFGFDHCIRHATPEALARLDLSALRVAFSGSEMVRPATMEAFQTTFAPAGLRPDALMACYGMAETVLLITGGDPEKRARFETVDPTALRRGEARPAGIGQRLASCGTPAPGMEVAIVDPQNSVALPERRVGEIWVRGPNVSPGYWRNDAATEASFDQLLNGETGWFRTGDLGFLMHDEVFVTGRLKETIVIRGQNHTPQDIEATVVASHEALADARVAAFATDDDAQEQLGVVIELRREVFREVDGFSQAAFAAIKAAITRDHGLQISQIALIRPGAMPVTPSGKVQRFACRDSLKDGSLSPLAEWRRAMHADTPHSGWRTALDQARPIHRNAMLVAEMQTVLTRLAGLPEGQGVSEQTRLFDLGLDSVAGIEFVSVLDRELKLTLDPTLIYEFPTLAALAPWLLEQLYPVTRTDSADDQDLAREIAALEALLKT